MSCRECERWADDPDRGAFFYRWKNANVEIVACRVHVKEIMDALNAAQDADPPDRSAPGEGT